MSNFSMLELELSPLQSGFFNALEQALHPHSAGESRRSRGRQPSVLLRAGYIRQLAAGIYSYLFLAQRSLLKITADRARGDGRDRRRRRCCCPRCNPAEMWQESGRWDVMGDNMFRLKDRFGRDLCLGMTHEESHDRDRARRAAQLQAASADLVSDPDQVPRRAASQVRAAARAPVHHEGFVLLRHGRSRARRGLREALRRPTAASSTAAA